MMKTFEFYEQLSRDLFDREPAQTLLLHANQLNADQLGELSVSLRLRSNKVVSLRQALQDLAYLHQDDYTGKSGISWLQRWWITEGNQRREEPKESEWVNKIAFPDKN